MRRAVVIGLFVFISMDAVPAGADVLVLQGGSRSEVTGFELVGRAVHIVTLNGKTYSIIRDAVDVEATLQANGMTPAETASPGWKHPQAAPPTAPEPPKPAPAKRSLPPKRAEPPKVAPPHTTPPEQEEARPPVRTPPPPRRGGDIDASGKRYRISLFFNGAVAASPLEFAETRQFEMFKEQALIDSRYRDPQNLGFEIGGQFLIKGPIGLSASVEMFRNDREAAFEAFLPHPFFFEQFREIAGRRAGLSHDEKALHLDAVFSKSWAGRFIVDFFGGPSVFFTRTEVLVDVLYSEVYPYDAVVPLGAEYGSFEDHPLGYNLGASATYRIAGSLGVDFGLRFSRGRVRLNPPNGGAVEFDAGGLRAGVGIRLLFP